MGYAIAELSDEASGGFEPRGAAKELWKSRDFEVIVSGPAETGKTWGCCEYLDALLWKYPGANGVMVRKTYAALIPAALKTYKRVTGIETGNSPIKAYGGEKPEWFDYPNGSRLWIAGLDNATKVLSSERDFFFVNQAEELPETDWEFLTMRATGRGAVMPYTRVFGDCNPAYPMHWIRQRKSLRMLESRHEDNPTLFRADGTITEQGKKSLAVLDNLKGVLYQRYRLGRWVQAEGTIYDGFDRAVHLIDPFTIPKEWRRFRGIDFGFNNPFVCQWWAQDPDGNLYLYREIYMTKRLVSTHARLINELSQGETYVATIADHDAEDRATLHSAGIQTIAAHKAVGPGIEAVQNRLKIQANGKPRLYIMKNCTVEIDPQLVADKLPHCTEQEYEVYIWEKSKDGKPQKEEPQKLYDHGMDTKRYVVCYVDNIGRKSISFA